MSVDEATLAAPAAGATVNADNPWPGLLAFRETDQGYFQGRQAETEELLRLVLRERLTVLFGLSGLGKSSLLQAGLFPKLRQENVFPVYIRLDFSSGQPNLVAQVIARIAREASARQIEGPAPKDGETLWEYFHRDGNNFWNARNRPVMPLLVFDQFEEMFTLGRLDPDRSAATEAFIDQLADLAECHPSAKLKAWIDEHPDQASAFNFGRHYYKVLLSIREDFLADLEALRARMPSVALNRMRLRRMNGEAALLVVSQAQHLIDSHVAEQVVRFVAADQRQLPLADLEVEPALLSVVCRELNNRRLHLGEPKISAGLLQGNQEQVLADFYERSTADLSPEARSFIEDHLLTVSGYRDSVALENALSTPGVSRQAVEALVERRLVRREDRGGTQRLELTHDLLAGVVRASRDSRRQREAAEKERAALLQAQEQQQKKLLESKKKLQVVFAIAAVFLMLTAVSVVTAAWAIRALETARREQVIAAEAKHTAATAQMQAARSTNAANYSNVNAQKSSSEAMMQAMRAREQAKEIAEQAKQIAALLQVLSNLNGEEVEAALNSQSAARLLPRVYMQIVNENDRDHAKQIAARLIAEGVLVLGIEVVPKKTGSTKTEVRYYRKADEPEAHKIADVLKNAGQKSARVQYLSQYENDPKIRPNRFEVWLANGSGGN